MLRKDDRQEPANPGFVDGKDRKSPNRAAALSYNPDKDAAPRVVAKGRRKIAEEMVALGRQAGVPIVENQELVDSLLAIDLEDPVPPELYAVVAEVLGWVLTLRETVRQDKPG